MRIRDAPDPHHTSRTSAEKQIDGENRLEVVAGLVVAQLATRNGKVPF